MYGGAGVGWRVGGAALPGDGGCVTQDLAHLGDRGVGADDEPELGVRAVRAGVRLFGLGPGDDLAFSPLASGAWVGVAPAHQDRGERGSVVARR